jgi:TRAP-type C4-dicarboxylate transport system permease small subunit
MMVLVSIDALFRYAFGLPLQFQYELTENYLMVAAILMPLAHVTRSGQHIAIDAFHHVLPAIVLRPLAVLGNLGMIALLLAVTYGSGLKAFEAFSLNETTFGVIDWPVGWSRIWVPLGCGLFCLRLIVDTLMNRDASVGQEGQEAIE